MQIKGIKEEDFTNYKKVSMYIAFPTCTWKCERECGLHGICQNAELAKAKNIEVSAERLVEHYLQDPISKAIVVAGLEPLDSFTDVLDLLKELRKYSEDDFVIYTGYTEEEVSDKVDQLKQYKKILIKFGRFVPNSSAKLDENLGVILASSNQYSKWIS